MKSVVIYKSKTGYTKMYAEWIAEALGCHAREQNDIDAGELMDYDTIIFGGGIYASGIAGIKLITKNYDALKDKNLLVWATGLTPEEDEEVAKMWEKNFNEEQLSHIRTFYLRGGFDFNKLGIKDKLLMKAFRKMLEKEKEPRPGMEGFLESFHEPQDYRNKDNIRELIGYVREISSFAP